MKKIGRFAKKNAIVIKFVKIGGPLAQIYGGV